MRLSIFLRFFLVNAFGVSCMLCSAFAQNTFTDFTDVVFKTNGQATKAGENCYRLTTNDIWSAGAIWYPTPVNLRENFRLEMELFVGCENSGADGIVFIFSPTLRVGYAGEGMGFAGLFPSLGIEFDTYQNYHLGDPPGDHVAVLADGSPNHRFDLAGPVSTRANLEDCKTHPLVIEWRSQEKELVVQLDGQNIIGLQKNIVADIFNSNASVYWGFSAATGQKFNEHRICFEKMVFEELPVDAVFTRPETRTLLRGETIPLTKTSFAAGRSELTKSSTTDLTKLLTLMRDHPEHNLTIYGHTDASGNDAANRALSLKRAQAIADFLVEHGIDKSRVKALGLGETFPIASNDTAAGRRANRRIEVSLFRAVP